MSNSAPPALVAVHEIDLVLSNDLLALQRARRDFLQRGQLGSLVRPLIRRSWERCSMLGVDPDRQRLETVAELQIEPWVLGAVDPVVQALGEAVLESAAAVILTNASGVIAKAGGDPHVLRQLHAAQPIPGSNLAEEVAGTNAVGTALEEGIGVQISGGEHLVEAFQGFSCTAVPVRHPLTRRVVLLLDLTTQAADLTPQVAKIVQRTAQQMERILYELLSTRERALLYFYVRELHRGAGAVVAANGRTTIASSVAANLLGQADYATLQAYGDESLRTGRAAERVVSLTSGQVVRVAVEPTFDGGEPVGVVMRLDPIAVPPPPLSPSLLPGPFAELVGQSRAFQEALTLARAALAQAVPVTIVGPSGSGKWTLARAMAESAGGRSVTVECAGIAEPPPTWIADLRRAVRPAAGLIVRHLDRLGAAHQDALLRFLLSGDGLDIVRCFTTVDPAALGPVDSGGAGLRRELLDRLAAVRIDLPPLRDRREDIPILARALLSRLNPVSPRGITPEAMQALAHAEWAGNARELENVLRGADLRARGRDITIYDLPCDLLADSDRPRLSRLEQLELEALRRALHEMDGNRAKAAAALGISRSTFYRKSEAYRRKGFPITF